MYIKSQINIRNINKRRIYSVELLQNKKYKKSKYERILFCISNTASEKKEV